MADVQEKDKEKLPLTTSQRARMEKNRLMAVSLREAKLIPHPSAKIDVDTVDKSIVKVHDTKYIDSGGGFLIEESSSIPQKIEKKPTARPAPVIDVRDKPVCIECEKEFATSYLFETFDYSACDNCRDNEDKHSLITKTEAKSEYLLQDCDLDKREPPLKCIIRKNPHNSRWGSMKLYLHIQVEERALLVWGTKEKLEEEKDLRNVKRETSKAKKYSKQLKELRMNVRSSLFDKTKAVHVHSYGEETYNEEDDTYTHRCTICQHEETYEKL